MNRWTFLTCIACCFVLASAPAHAQTGGGYDLTWSTLDGGGGTSTGGGYKVSGTIGGVTIPEQQYAKGTTSVEFSSVGSPAIGLVGAANLVVKQEDRRTQTTSGSTTPAQTLSVTLRPNVTLSGTIFGLNRNGVTLTATAPGATSESVTLSAGTGCGAPCTDYSVDGLGVTSSGDPLTWTIDIDEVGFGTGQISLDVTQTTPSAGTTPHRLRMVWPALGPPPTLNLKMSPMW